MLVKEGGGAGAAEVVANEIVALPEDFVGLAVKAGGAGGTEGKIYAGSVDDGGG